MTSKDLGTPRLAPGVPRNAACLRPDSARVVWRRRESIPFMTPSHPSVGCCSSP